MRRISRVLISVGLVTGMAMTAHAESSPNQPEGAVAQADGDPEKGRRVFRQCQACHVMEEGKRRMGPSLAGIFGKTAGSMEGFKYSKAMASSGVVWDDATMTEFLRAPKAYIKGTKMTFRGIRKDDQIADLLAWMKENGG